MNGVRDLPGIRRFLYKRAERRRIDELSALYRPFIDRGDLVFDVGAHHGLRTDGFLALGARVVAVEPQRSALDVLEKRFGRNRRVEIVPKAAGAEEGEAELNIAADASTISSIEPDWNRQRFPDQQWDRTETVPVTTLDRLIDEFDLPAFIKLDVEGYEPQVLEGLSRPVPALCFEWIPQATDRLERCIRRLQDLGLTAFAHSFYESYVFEDGWVTGQELRRALSDLDDPEIWGDVYACQDPRALNSFPSSL